MEEVWKDISGYEGLYQVSDMGNVKSLGNGRTHKKSVLLKPSACGKSMKYRHVTLYKNGERKSRLIHLLVWEAFRGTIPNGMQVNHIDENPGNNALSNLNLLTPKDNSNWGSLPESRINKGGKWVIKLSKNNEILHFYQTASQANRETGVNRSDISKCCRGELPSAGGFVWKYAE